MRCNGCGLDKTPEDFGRNQGMPEGRLKTCRACMNARQRARHAATPPEIKRASRRAWREANRDSDRASRRRYVAANAEKVRARRALYRAVKAGRLAVPTRCSRCGAEPPPKSDGRRMIEAHHADYDYPLDVEWLCHDCHVHQPSTKD